MTMANRALPASNCLLTPTGFDSLPTETLETIFYQVPHGDLMLNVSRVCKHWRDVIANEKFMRYKKLYYAYKKGKGKQHDDAQLRLERMIREKENFMDSAHLCFLGFIKKIGTFIPINSSGSAPLIRTVLKEAPDYSLVEDLFREQAALSDCRDPTEPNPLCALAALLVLAPEAETTTSLLHRLLSSEVPLCLVLEIFYAAATFFLYFHRKLKIPDKHHYFVFAAIYSFESKVQVNMTTLTQLFDRHNLLDHQRDRLLQNDRFKRMTYEQYSIVNHDIREDEVIKINAFAGTGKTTTLIAYTEVRPHTRFLYLAYNKSIQKDAEARFPRNVTCRTIHSAAYKPCGVIYSKNRKLKNLKNGTVMDVLGHTKGINSFYRAEFAVKTLNNFIASKDHVISFDHVPFSTKDGPVTPEHRQQHYDDAAALWAKMKQYESPVPMTFDGYLKLFQLRENVDLATAIGTDPFDVILVDEAQDMTPATIDIIERQSTPKIMVGDPNQQIYCFRGAVNAMDLIQGANIHYLTKSFRFGPQIAHVCDALLSSMKNVQDRTIIGNSNRSTINGEVTGQLCVISRTNSRQFAEVVKALNKPDFWGTNGPHPRPRIAFAGDEKKDNDFRLLLDIERLHSKKKEPLSDGFIGRFSDFKSLLEYAEKVEDYEILGKCKTVISFGADVPQHIANIRLHMSPQAEADIVFTTAHKSKGLEFDTVKVTDDFIPGLDPHDPRMKEDEKNLIYVAASRAKTALILNETLVSLMSGFGESFVTLKPNDDRINAPLAHSEDLQPAQRCIINMYESPSPSSPAIPCHRPITLENSWVPVRTSITIRLPYEEETSQNTVKEGSFCRAHGLMALPSYIPFLKTPIHLTKALPSDSGDATVTSNFVNEDVDYDKMMINPLNRAFRREMVSRMAIHYVLVNPVLE